MLKNLNHLGIKIELIGKVDICINDNTENSLNNNNKNQFNKFLSLKNNISSQGTLNKEFNIFNFTFQGKVKPYDSYRGKIFQYNMLY